MGKTYRKNKFHYGWNGSYSDDNKNREDWILHEIRDSYLRAVRNGESVPRTKEEIEFEKESRIEEFKAEELRYQREKAWYHEEMKYYAESVKKHIEKMRTDDEYRQNNTFRAYKPSIPRPPYVCILLRKRVPLTKTFDEYYAENYDREAKYFDKKFSRGKIRDGYYSETGRTTGYKKQTSKQRRIQDRRNIHKIMVDIDAADDMVWYTHKDGKKHIWDWW